MLVTAAAWRLRRQLDVESGNYSNARLTFVALYGWPAAARRPPSVAWRGLADCRPIWTRGWDYCVRRGWLPAAGCDVASECFGVKSADPVLALRAVRAFLHLHPGVNAGLA